MPLSSKEKVVRHRALQFPVLQTVQRRLAQAHCTLQKTNTAQALVSEASPVDLTNVAFFQCSFMILGEFT